MGLFGKLFDKKECSVCGGEIGLLGNRKLEDGNLCKECAAKLSPWFSDRRQSTVAEIQEQLAYREANQAKVSSFRTTRTLGERTKVLLDEDAGLFIWKIPVHMLYMIQKIIWLVMQGLSRIIPQPSI